MPRLKPPKLPAPLEKHVARSIVAVAWQCHGIKLERRNTGMAMRRSKRGKSRPFRAGKRGDPDYSGIWPPGSGRRFDVEVKRPGGWPEPHQIDRIRELQAEGVTAIWADSVECFGRIMALLESGRTIAIREDGSQVAAWPNP